MRLTTRTDLALRALMFCAVNPDVIVRKNEIAEACNASLNHLGLVINLLAQAGFVETARGRNGGVRLAKPADAISVGAVSRYLESDLSFAECFAREENTCPLAAYCQLTGVLCKALEAFYSTLDTVSLADLTRDNSGLRTMLARKPVPA